jgi:superfamily I DNA/RNA helicase
VSAAAALPYLSRDAAAARHLGDVIPLARCLYRDDIEDGVASGPAFRRRIMQLVASPPRDPLSEQAESIHRAIIHPDTVIGSLQLPFPAIAGQMPEDQLLVLDRKQEALAKTLGVGHRVIRGAAGSGKTIVLTYRARLLAETFPRQQVLVTCYTHSLAGRLRRQLAPWRNITVNNLDALMARARRAADLEVADYKKFSREELAVRALRALDARPAEIAHYHHVLVDEAQDFPTPALQFAVRLLVEGSDSFLAVADPVQNIFGTHFTWKAAGINAVGRTRWLDQSYRNTREILEYAHNFVLAGGGFELSADPDPESAVSITAPRFSPRSGPIPVILDAVSRPAEVVSMAKHVAGLLERGVVPGDIAILYGTRWTGGFDWPDAIRTVFSEWRIPICWANDPGHRDRRDHIGEDPTTVILSTIHAAKGLEFRYVVLCGYLDDRPPEESKISRSLIYVGMTRATHELALSASGRHRYLVDLERS